MIIVLDTNVLVSGLLSPYGAPAEIVRMVANEEVRLCYDSRILHEYREVLLRPRFQFDRDHVEDLIAHIREAGQLATAKPLEKRLAHEADEPFLEVMLASAAECLVTGNLKHFPKYDHKPRILSPSDFIAHWRKTV